MANWGNLVNRVLGFAYKRWDGMVPEPGGFEARDEAFLDEVREGFQTVGALYEQVKLKAAMNEAWKAWLGNLNRPTRTCIGGVELEPGVLVEITSTAAK